MYTKEIKIVSHYEGLKVPIYILGWHFTFTDTHTSKLWTWNSDIWTKAASARTILKITIQETQQILNYWNQLFTVQMLMHPTTDIWCAEGDFFFESMAVPTILHQVNRWHPYPLIATQVRLFIWFINLTRSHIAFT